MPAKFAENCSRSPARKDELVPPGGKMRLDSDLTVPVVFSVNEPGPLNAVNVPFSGREVKVNGIHVPVVQSCPKVEASIKDDTSRFTVRDLVWCAFTAVRGINPETNIHRLWAGSGWKVQVCHVTKSAFVPSGAIEGDTLANALASGVE
jgi:hypothetical protein